MKKIALASLLLCQLFCTPAATADEAPVLGQPGPADDMLFERLHPELQPQKKAYPTLDLKIDGIENNKPIPVRFAYCKPDGKGETINGDNISPAIHWLNTPEAAKSFALIVVDTDVPADFTDANKQRKEIPANAPRQSFYHWVLTDIPSGLLALYEGADSKGIAPGGKPVGRKSYGIDGKNDYAKVYPGSYGGYDGPCPPWNDLRLHHYHFTFYALDVPSLNLPNPVTGSQAKLAMEGHILAKGEVVGTYSNNPRWLEQFKKAPEKKEPELIPGEKFDPKAN